MTNFGSCDHTSAARSEARYPPGPGPAAPRASDSDVTIPYRRTPDGPPDRPAARTVTSRRAEPWHPAAAAVRRVPRIARCSTEYAGPAAPPQRPVSKPQPRTVGPSRCRSLSPPDGHEPSDRRVTACRVTAVRVPTRLTRERVTVTPGASDWWHRARPRPPPVPGSHSTAGGAAPAARTKASDRRPVTVTGATACAPAAPPWPTGGVLPPPCPPVTARPYYGVPYRPPGRVSRTPAPCPGRYPVLRHSPGHCDGSRPYDGPIRAFAAPIGRRRSDREPRARHRLPGVDPESAGSDGRSLYCQVTPVPGIPGPKAAFLPGYGDRGPGSVSPAPRADDELRKL
eukprot:159245-Hanusia_phi.AAC.1